jgi:DMSO/TMAO reductase YedYZ molybdopterin-dependent catalytic subunit
VLSAGPTPVVRPDEWRLDLTGPAGEQASWTWEELQALPSEEITTDIHCVTKWSRLGTNWRGVSLDTMLADVETEAEYALVHSYGGYTRLRHVAASTPPEHRVNPTLNQPGVKT